MKKTVIGYDIGGTKCAVILAEIDDGIKILEKAMFPTTCREETIEHLFSITDEWLGKYPVKPLAIGISCGGPLNSKTGVIQSPPHLPDWVDVPITQMCEQRYGIPAFLQNDANACALVEWKLGAGKNCDDLIFLTMGTGFGAGIISGGKLIDGATGLAGEIGHVRLREDGPLCYGKKGCVESFCSGAGIAEFAKSYITDTSPAWLTSESLTTKDIGKAAESGDAVAVKILQDVGERLGESLAILVDVLNPCKIVIGSIFVRCEAYLRDAMEAALMREALPCAACECRVEAARCGEQIGDFAAVLVACYGAKIDFSPQDEIPSAAMTHLEKLLQRYPALMELRSNLEDAYRCLYRTYKNGGKVLCCGNGGSAADAEHIVGELMKGFLLPRKADLPGSFSALQGALPAIALSGHPALSTAIANDMDPEMVFAQQLYGYGRAEDTLICLSTSGNSKNVVNAAELARTRGIRVVSFTGEKDSLLSQISDVCIQAPSSCTAEIQEYHLPIYHTLCAMLEQAFFA